jgi:dihydrofolate reductase
VFIDRLSDPGELPAFFLNADSTSPDQSKKWLNLRRIRMAHLIYSAISSLDGFIEDREGKFDWAAPDEEVHKFINDLERAAGTFLFGRRMYETMLVWETDPDLINDSPLTRDYAEIWQAANKIVYSRTLRAVSTRKTQLERTFDPESIRQLKEALEQDILIGGPELAAHAFRAGLIDECQLFLTPIIVGGGKRSLPDNVRIELELLEERRFGNGMVFLRFRNLHGRYSPQYPPKESMGK